MKTSPHRLAIPCAVLLAAGSLTAALVSANDLGGSTAMLAAEPDLYPTPTPPEPPEPPDFDSVEIEMQSAAADMQRAAREMQETMMLAQADIFEATPGVPGAPPPVGWGMPGRRTPDSVRVLSSGDLTAAQEKELQEDLAVMTRLLDKAAAGDASDSRQRRVMGLRLHTLSFGGAAPARALYLQDYGVLFSVPVDIALLPPPAKPATAAAVESEQDTEWEEARREVYGKDSDPHSPFGTVFRDMGDIELGGRQNRTARYDEAKVKELRQSVLQALKNASRIRKLAPEDRILVCLVGPAAATDSESTTVIRKQVARVEVRSEQRTRDAAPEEHVVVLNQGAAPGQGSTMTLRITKADADAFAKGSLDLEGFAARAKVAVYPGGAAANNHWTF